MSDDRADRPITFLVSLAGTRGAADVLERHRRRSSDGSARGGSSPHPESSLAYAAARVVEQGGSPVHLAIGTAHECYLTPALPNILLPLWDYPEVPAIDMNRNSRMNWARVASQADLLVAPSESTVEAFRRSGVTTPAVVAPIPAAHGWSDLATWGPDWPVTVHLPHVVWGGGRGPAAEGAAKASRHLRRRRRRRGSLALDRGTAGAEAPPEGAGQACGQAASSAGSSPTSATRRSRSSTATRTA